jgi:exopolysaccharide biosynthesis polyprenyl glycosylphosphotransferase
VTTLRRELLVAALKLFDLALMIGSFAASAILNLQESARLNITDFLAIRIKLANFVLFACLVFLWHWALCIFRLYDSRRTMRARADVVDVALAISTGTLLVAMVGTIFHIEIIDAQFLSIFWITVTSISIIYRIVLRWLLQHIRRRGRNLRHILIIGTNSRALELVRKVESKPELGYRILGFVDQSWRGLEECKSKGYEIVSDFDNLTRFLRTNVVDEVIIALPIASLHMRAAEIALACQEQGITTRVLSNIFDLKQARSRSEEVEGAPLITNSFVRTEGWPAFAKRALDIVLSSLLLLACAPLFLTVAALVKLTSAGPALFAQYRVGYNKRRFKMWKFRTMAQDAEQRLTEVGHLNEVSGPVFKIRNDPRVTRVGRILRKTSVDELPQLFNVLRGDMSLVGPRPLPVRDYEGFNVDWQRRRFSVRPGITCLWQINGRSSMPFQQWMELDLQYIDKWSFWLDLQILVRTIPAVLRGLGAA